MDFIELQGFLDILQIHGFTSKPHILLQSSPPKASTASTYHRTLPFSNKTYYPPCAKCVINGTAATVASVVVGTQKQCGSSAAKQRMPVRDEYLARIHVLSSVSPSLLRWVFVVPVLVGRCWFQELLNCLTLSGLIGLVGNAKYWLMGFLIWLLASKIIHK